MTISMEQMQALLQQQQNLFEKSQARLIEMMSQQLSIQSSGVTTKDEASTPESLMQQICEFHFDAIGGVTFDCWFYKYEDIFEWRWHTFPMTRKLGCCYENLARQNTNDS
jgi:hypothetical protein